jgi:uncharacterized membrane protein YphA (DoxX/SURF4 family)
MLSIFPNLYNYVNLVPDLFRIFLGLYLLKTAWDNYMMIRQALKPQKAIFWSILEAVGAGLILSGLWVQPTALVFALLTASMILFRNKIPAAKMHPVEFQILLVIVYIALAVLGPGLFAIDLPL